MISRLILVSFAMVAIAGLNPALAKPKSPPPPSDTSPVVTPDTTPPPAGAAAPVGSIQVSGSPSPVASPGGYVIPVGGAALAPPPTGGPSEPPVVMRAEDCLRANVERISRVEPSAKLAVDLLLDDVCADEVDAASLFVRNRDALARFNPVSERGRAGLSTARVDDETGQIIAPPSVDVSSAVDAAERTGIRVAPNLRKYAAELVVVQKSHAPSPVKKTH